MNKASFPGIKTWRMKSQNCNKIHGPRAQWPQWWKASTPPSRLPRGRAIEARHWFLMTPRPQRLGPPKAQNRLPAQEQQHKDRDDRGQREQQSATQLFEVVAKGHHGAARLFLSTHTV